MTWPAFMATTMKEDVAYSFMKRAAQPIIFEIHGAFVGYSIKAFSRFSNEEVLLEPETTFRIVSIRDDVKDPKIKRIVVDVQPTPLMIKGVVENFAKREAQLNPAGMSAERLSPGWRRITSPKGETFYYNIKTEEVQAEPPVMSISDLPFSDVVRRPSAMNVFLNMPPRFYETLDKSFLSASFKNLDVIGQKSQKKAEKLLADGTLERLRITIDEAKVLFSYTYEAKEKKENTPCYIMNKILADRNDNKLMAYRGYILHLLKALRKLSPVDPGMTTLYRGIDGKYLKFDEDHYKVGNIMTWPAFTSATPNESIAYKFSSKAAIPVIFEIRGPFVGYDIESFSNFPEEKEILLEPETTFRIDSIQDDPKNPKGKRIKVCVRPNQLMIKEAVEIFARNEWNQQQQASLSQSYAQLNQSYAQLNQSYSSQNFLGQTSSGSGNYSQAPMSSPSSIMNPSMNYSQAPTFVSASGSFNQIGNVGGINQGGFNGNGYNNNSYNTPQFNFMNSMSGSGGGYGQMYSSGGGGGGGGGGGYNGY